MILFTAVNYAEQQRYLRASQLWGTAMALLLLADAVTCAFSQPQSRYVTACFALVVLALAGSILYTPSYLHLGVNQQKPALWQIKIRWRIIAAALLLGLLPARNMTHVLVVLAAAAWLTLTNWLGAHIRYRLPAYFWFTDLMLLGVLLLNRQMPLLLVTALVALSLHLTVLLAKHPVGFALVFGLWNCPLLYYFAVYEGPKPRAAFAFPALLLISAFGTAWLVHRAARRNAANREAALAELTHFTGYSDEHVREMWATSDRRLAENWQAAQLGSGASPEKLAAWYRDNSELYLFAISAYNLDYKRIRSNLGVLRFAHGRCLDYGAGNGELILELARRGHPAAYFDVDGMTMQFARSRARQRALDVQFFSAKPDLAAAAGRSAHGDGDVQLNSPVAQYPNSSIAFDAIFSFDVLEHLPDLAGELSFLASLLNPGGVLVFDVPAGATRNHPMHLDHQLDFKAHLRSLGLAQVLTWRDRLPFRKQEKYCFRAGLAQKS